MTRDSAKDDRELSKAVAVAVMGWIPCDEWRVDAGYRGIAKHCKHESCFPSPSVGGSAMDCPPSYSTDIAAAMQVVERFTQGSLGPRTVHLWVRPLITTVIPDMPMECRCVIYPQNERVNPAVAYADSLPRAICLAALETVDSGS